MSKYNNELHKHKAADTIKWIVAFVLIFALIGAVVSIGLRFGGVIGNGGEKAPAEQTPTPDPDITDDPPIDMTDYSIQPGQYYDKIYITPDSAALQQYATKLFTFSSDPFMAGFLVFNKGFEYEPWIDIQECESDVQMFCYIADTGMKSDNMIGRPMVMSMTMDETMIMYYSPQYMGHESENTIEENMLVWPGYNNIDEEGALLGWDGKPISGVIVPLYAVVELDKYRLTWIEFATNTFKADFDACFSSKSFGKFEQIDHYTGEPVKVGYNDNLFLNPDLSAWQAFYAYAEEQGLVNDNGEFEIFKGRCLYGSSETYDMVIYAEVYTESCDDGEYKLIDLKGKLIGRGSSDSTITIAPFELPPDGDYEHFDGLDVNGWFDVSDYQYPYIFDSTTLPVELFNTLFASTPFAEYYHDFYLFYRADGVEYWDFGVEQYGETYELQCYNAPLWHHDLADMTQFRYELTWLNPSYEWAQGKDPEDYLDLQVTADKVTITCKQPFGEEIKLSVYDGEELVYSERDFRYKAIHQWNEGETLLVKDGRLELNQSMSSDVRTDVIWDSAGFRYSLQNAFSFFGGNLTSCGYMTLDGRFNYAVNWSSVRLALVGNELLIGGEEGLTYEELTSLDNNNIDLETIKQGIEDNAYEHGQKFNAGTLTYEDRDGRTCTIYVYIKLSETFYEI